MPGNDSNNVSDSYEFHDLLHNQAGERRLDNFAGSAPVYDTELFADRSSTSPVHHHHYEGTGANHSGIIAHTHVYGSTSHVHQLVVSGPPHFLYGYSVHSH